MPSIRYGSKTSGFTSRICSMPKFLAIRTALAMFTMSCGFTRTRIGLRSWEAAGRTVAGEDFTLVCICCRAAPLDSSFSQERRIVLLGPECRGEADLFDGLHVRFLGLHQTSVDQLEQGVIEGYHPAFTIGLHNRWNLEGLPF